MCTLNVNIGMTLGLLNQSSPLPDLIFSLLFALNTIGLIRAVWTLIEAAGAAAAFRPSSLIGFTFGERILNNLRKKTLEFKYLIRNEDIKCA